MRGLFLPRPLLTNYSANTMQTLHQIQQLFEQFLLDNKFSREPRELYEPIDYILSLGGKRLRPAVLLMGHYLFDDSVEQSLPAAFAVEVFHNFTLLHDDIMDDAPLRRGKPTVHEKYNLNTGILSGDVMLVYAYEYLTKLEHPRLKDVLKIFNRFAIEVCEGQQLDINFEKRNDVSIEEYIRMIELKTSVLLGGALKIGALLGGANEKDAQLLYEFGRNLGIAFQLQDDVLDTFGDPEKFGKKTGGDIAQNKKTYLYLKALEVADQETKTALKACYNNPDMEEGAKIREVIRMFNQLGIRALAEEKQACFQKEALDHLSKIQAEPGRKVMLESFADFLMKREF